MYSITLKTYFLKKKTFMNVVNYTCILIINSYAKIRNAHFMGC